MQITIIDQGDAPLNQYTAAGSAAFLYDANGNLTSDGANSFAYDTENRMVQVSGARSATLRYDPLGRLYETSAGTAASITRMLYDGDELTAEYNASGALLRRYVHGRGVDDPLIWYEGNAVSPATRRHILPNYQGSITTVTGSAGNGIAINRYDGVADEGAKRGQYGIPASTNIGRFQYSAARAMPGCMAKQAQAWLPEVGMYYYKARIYSPTLGRFMQTDPIGYEDQVNLYAYVGNDPVNMVDPDGRTVEYFGTKDQRKEIQKAVQAVISSSPELRARFEKLVDSKFNHQVSFAAKQMQEASAITIPTSKVGALHGTGTGGKVIINPEYSDSGYKDTQGRYLSSMVAHELLGHSYNNDAGKNQRYETNPKSGLSEEEHSAMKAENIFNRGSNRPEEKCYGSSPLDGKSKC